MGTHFSVIVIIISATELYRENIPKRTFPVLPIS